MEVLTEFVRSAFSWIIGVICLILSFLIFITPELWDNKAVVIIGIILIILGCILIATSRASVRVLLRSKVFKR